MRRLQHSQLALHVPPRYELQGVHRIVDGRNCSEISAYAAHCFAVHVVVRDLGLVRLQPLLQEVLCIDHSCFSRDVLLDSLALNSKLTVVGICPRSKPNLGHFEAPHLRIQEQRDQPICLWTLADHVHNLLDLVPVDWVASEVRQVLELEL